MTQMSKKRIKTPGRRKCCESIGDLLEPRFFKALCEPNRIAMLIQLARCCRACTVSEIADCCTVDISVVSRHLAVLRDAGVLDARKKGKQVYYRVRHSLLASTLRSMADVIEGCAEPAGSSRKG